MNMASVVMEASEDELTVFNYWVQKTLYKIRSPKLAHDYFKRIRKRLDEGFTVDELKRCVDAALNDPFYRERGYCKQPDVIWRNAERVQSLLVRGEHVVRRPIPL